MSDPLDHPGGRFVTRPRYTDGLVPDGGTSLADGLDTLESRLREAARRVGPAPAFVDVNEVLATHNDLRRMRDGGRGVLRDAGVGRHDRVALVMASDWRMAVSLVVAMSACAVAPLDPGLTDRELVSYLNRLRPRAVLADRVAAPRLRSLVDGGTPVLVWPVEQLDGSADGEDPDADDPALLLFTSGTTATPKIAQITHRNLVAAAHSVGYTLNLDAADRALNAMPLHHGHGIFPGVLAPLVVGGSTICGRLTTGAALGEVAQSAMPTWYSAAPVVHHSILAMARTSPLVAEALRLRLIRSTSSALPVAVLAQLEETLSAPVVEAYALTEAPGQVASNPLDGPRKAGTVGRPQHTEVVLLTADGELTDSAGRIGEVLVRGPNVIPGYLGVPADEQPFLDGWLRTGDQAIFDHDGYLTLSGRITDIISRGAEKISPAEVEAVLATHPAVQEVAAFGRPHPTLGEESAAAVVLRAGASTTVDELRVFAAERLAAYKVPVRIHLLPAIPRNSAGKVLRHRLKELTVRSSPRLDSEQHRQDERRTIVEA